MSVTDMNWKGVMPAITTPLDSLGAVDHAFLAKHVGWLVDHGATGIVALGSLGEGATLTFDEKLAILTSVVDAVASRVPVVAAISALSTQEGVRLAQRAEAIGCRGLMVLPPYVHTGEWPEIRAHFLGVLRATEVSCMLYNNPIAYGTDLRPEHVQELADTVSHVHAVKESSGDLRRITAIRALVGDRLAIFAGLDDMVVEGVAAGAVGWVAGLVNALPKESMALFEYAVAGDHERAFSLYRWFLPLLRLDTVPEFVQLIKLVQSVVGMGSEVVRLPRLPVAGALRERAMATITEALSTRPELD